MSQQVLVSEQKGLSQGQRFVDAFLAPAETFRDICRNASWWLPVVVVCVLSLLFAYTVLHKVGLPGLVDGVIHGNGSLEDRIANSSPEQAAAIRHGLETQFRFMYMAPVFIVVIGLIVSGVFLATANFGFGGRASYAQMLAVWFYGTLPMIFISIITVVTLYAGMQSDSFNIKNTVGTNVGYYLEGGGSPRWLLTMLSSFDIFAVWSAILLTLGVSIVARIKRSSAAVVVFGWWALYVLAQTGIAAVTG